MNKIITSLIALVFCLWKLHFQKEKKNNPRSKLSEGHDCILKSQIIAKSLTWFLLVESSCWILVTVNNLNILRTEKRWDQTHRTLWSVRQSCVTLCDSVDCSPPGSSVHGVSTGKNTGVGCHARLQGIFPTQESNQSLPHCRQILYQVSCREAQTGLFPKEPKCHSPGTFSGNKLHTGVFCGSPSTYSVACSLWSIPSEGLIFHSHAGTHSTVFTTIDSQGTSHQTSPISETPLRCICKIHGFMFSLTPWLSAWGCLFRSCLELRSGKALDCFLSDVIIPAGPQTILASAGKHHLPRIITKREEENVDIPIDNTCTVPACVTVSCVLPSPIWKPTR